MSSSVRADELHARVIEFVSSPAEHVQRQALDVLCIVLAEPKQDLGIENGNVSM